MQKIYLVRSINLGAKTFLMLSPLAMDKRIFVLHISNYLQKILPLPQIFVKNESTTRYSTDYCLFWDTYRDFSIYPKGRE